MFVLQITETGAQDLQIAFTLLEAEFANWSEQFEKLEPESAIVLQRRFEDEGPGWLELTPRYAAWKSKHFPGKTILRRTDAGFLSFATGNVGNVTRIAPLKAEFGSDIEYLAFQPESRLIVEITDQNEEKFLQVVITDKTERIRELGFEIQ